MDRLRCIVACVSTVVGAGGALPSPSLRAQDVTIQHVTVVSPERSAPLPNVTVRIHDGTIADVSVDGGRTAGSAIDGTGLYLVPGLIDSHVHLGLMPGTAVPGMTPQQFQQHAAIANEAADQIPRSYLGFGFTTLVDLVSTPRAMARWNRHAVAPNTFFCGAAALEDGYPMNYAPKPARYDAFPYFIVDVPVDSGPHSPQAVVARMKRDGAICVKTFFERGYGGVSGLPVPHIETIRALVRDAHAAGLPVILHANSVEAQTFGLDAGVDIIAHGLWNWNDTTGTTELVPQAKVVLDRVVQSHVGWQPTIQVVAGLRDLFDTAYLSRPLLRRALPAKLIDWYGSAEGGWFRTDLESTERGAPVASFGRVFAQLVARAERATAYVAQHGGRLLFGTDTPSAPTYANPPGLNGWLEMQNLVDAGVTPRQVFVAATLANARVFGLEHDIGTVEIGKRANLLLLRDDPTLSVDAYRTIVRVVLSGRVLDPATLTASGAQ